MKTRSGHTYSAGNSKHKPRPRRHKPVFGSPTYWDSSLAASSTSFDSQDASPLFALLPPELRNTIFKLALAPYPDTSVPALPFDSPAFRPETEYPCVQDVALLRVCRRIYLETYSIPAALVTIVSWALVRMNRAPPDAPRRPPFGCMLTKARAPVRALHVYAQQCGIEQPGWLHIALGCPGWRDPAEFVPGLRTLRVTLRHTDFWGWEEDHPLQLDGSEGGKYGPQWRAALAALPRLETFELALETLERRRAELDALIEPVCAWKIPLGNGRVLSANGIALRAHTWEGSSKFCGAVDPPPGTRTLPFYVVTVRWTAPAIPGAYTGGDSMSDVGSSDYTSPFLRPVNLRDFDEI
jgi:hypothetical protein